jgi:multimeric flavodoxin WrbA
MKIYALNASPRKGWNSDEMLASFINGVKEVNPDIEVEKVNIYDLDFKGCRSCFACQLKSTEAGEYGQIFQEASG